MDLARRALPFRPPTISGLCSSPHAVTRLLSSSLPVANLATTRSSSTTTFRSFASNTQDGEYSSSSDGSSTAGNKQGKAPRTHPASLAAKCRVLPFSVSREGAQEEWGRHHQGFFTTHPGGIDSLKAVLLPFWCLSADANVHVQSAQVGRDRLVSRYNPATRRTEAHWQTDWTQVYLDWRYTRHWPASSKEFQEYGGSKYRHDPALDRMKPGDAIVRALPYKEFERTQRPGGGSGGSVGLEGLAGIERMYPFQLGPVEAVERAQERIRRSELAIAERSIREQFKADRVQLVVLQLALTHTTATPVFVPVYVAKTRIRSAVLRTYIAGWAPGLSAGPVLPNPERVATVAAAGTPLLLLATGLMGSLTGLLWAGVVLPGVLSYLAASFWPELHGALLGARARFQRPLTAQEQEQQEQWMSYEWVRQDADDGFYRRARFEQSYTGSSGGASSSRTASGGSPTDPEGHYRVLGVSPSSSTQEVQAAFRAAALKWHPDRQPDPAKKAEATERFQRLQHAYSVLRDPARRAQYDSTGRA